MFKWPWVLRKNYDGVQNKIILLEDSLYSSKRKICEIENAVILQNKETRKLSDQLISLVTKINCLNGIHEWCVKERWVTNEKLDIFIACTHCRAEKEKPELTAHKSQTTKQVVDAVKQKKTKVKTKQAKRVNKLWRR